LCAVLFQNSRPARPDAALAAGKSVQQASIGTVFTRLGEDIKDPG